jgi:hypothetical protein
VITTWSRVSPCKPCIIVPNAGTIVRIWSLKLDLVCVIGITDDGHAVGSPGNGVCTRLFDRLKYMFAGGPDATHTPSSHRTNVVVEFQSMA